MQEEFPVPCNRDSRGRRRLALGPQADRDGRPVCVTHLTGGLYKNTIILRLNDIPNKLITTYVT